MTDVLARIEAYKREEIAAAKLRVPQAEIEKRAAAAPPARGFCKAIDAHLAAGRPALIAEIKKASPSKGLIRADFDPPSLARAYEAGGATCLSVLTDEPSFQGKPDFLARSARRVQAARAAQGFPVRALPGVRGPGLGRGLHPRHHGVPDATRTRKLLTDTAHALGMDVLVEVHDRGRTRAGAAAEHAAHRNQQQQPAGPSRRVLR